MKWSITDVVCRIFVLHRVENKPAYVTVALVGCLVQGGGSVDSGRVLVRQVGHDRVTDLQVSVPCGPVEWREPVPVGGAGVGPAPEDQPADVQPSLSGGDVKRRLPIAGPVCPVPVYIQAFF